MFALDDSISDEILFAMENQELDYMVEAETGAVVALNDDALDSAFGSLEEGDDLIAPPEWTSGDGYALMEAFAAGVGDPIAKNGLYAALERGRGVFKAFKKALEPYEALERRWFDYKRAAMAKRVGEWYDQARVARGLERLGPEPDEADDLLSGDFSFRVAGREAWPECVPLFRRGLDEALSSFPESLVEYEYTRLEREISEGGREGLVLAIAEAMGGALAGIAAARKVFVADGSFGKLAYLYVAPEHRRLGLGRRLAEAARERLERDGIPRFVVDMPFVPSGFGSSMAAFGYEPFGTRYIKTGD
ncbi:MAG: GNAT family N-acetyltransferase [Spirochaetes bacterium]|nr:GNAT family N-acetyltransferase [Spirochaetota bacterium]MBU1081572.1 GNAT family N-acetyltransferase [Spirochaetota bacterium]